MCLCARFSPYSSKAGPPSLLVDFDHRSAAAGIAADRVDRDRIVGRNDAGIHQRANQANRTGRIAAGIGDLPGIGDSLGLALLHFRESHTPSPDARDAPCWHRAASALRCPSHPPAPPPRAPLRRVGRARRGRPAAIMSRRAAGSRRCSLRRLLRSISANARRRSRMPSPVVPASPSMNTLGLVAIPNPPKRRHGRAFPDIPTSTMPRTHGRDTPGHDGPVLANYRLLNWKLRRAFALPYFLRSTTRESRVRKPATFRMPRRSGS